MKKYDIIVIGTGGGGKISIPAYELGYKVAIIEKEKVGGTCLNRGCIPSKMIIHPANVALQVKDSKKFGINSKVSSINFSRIIKRVSDTVDNESESIRRRYVKSRGFDFYPYEAKFISNKVLEVNNEKITAKKIFIAAGARPFIPPIDGLKNTPYMTSAEALRNRKLPKKLVVIGGGYIACELGHAYSSLGSDVHFIVRKYNMLVREDSQISQEFTKEFKKRHNCYFGVSPIKVEYKNKKFTIHLENKKGKKSRLIGDALLVATGVKPNADILGLENTKIKTNKGFIKVNKYMETSVKGIYAIGDIAGNYMFRHSVNFEGEFLFQTLFVDKKRKPIKYPPMPHAVFTHPEIGSVGLTEDELKEKNIDYVAGINNYSASAMGMARLSDHGFVKLLFHKKTKKLLGAHILGEEAATMIHQLIYAITFGATVDNLLDMIYIHPALPEIIRNAIRKAKDEFD